MAGSGPRKRSLFRPRNIALVVLLVLITGVVWLAATVVRMARAKPGNAIDFAQRMEELGNAHRPAEGTDGFPLLIDLVKTRRELEDGSNSDDTHNVVQYDALVPGIALANTTIAVERPRVEAVLSRYAASPMPGLWDKVVQAQRYARPMTRGPILLQQLPELLDVLGLVRMNSARMYLAAERGQLNEISLAYEQSLAASRLLAQDPILIAQLVSIAARARADADLRQILMDRRLPGPILDQIAQAQARQHVTSPRSLGIRGEKLVFQDFVQRTHSDDGRGSGTLLPTELESLAAQGLGTGASAPAANRAFNVLGLLAPSKRETLRKGDDYYDQMIAAFDTPHAKRDPEVVRKLELFVAALDKRDVVLKTIAPALGKAFQSLDQADTDAAGTRLMLEIERFRAARGRLPATLDELGGTLPAEVRASIITDPFTDTPFGYRVLDKPESRPVEGLHGRDYIVYSFGRDRTDNGGREVADKANPYAALHREEGEGYDWVINQPRGDKDAK